MPTYPTIPAQAADAIYASTLQEYSSKVKSQTFDKMPVAAAMWQNKETGTLGNGRHEWRVEAGLNDNAKTMTSDADTVTFSQQSNLTVAWYDYMAFLAVPVQKSMIRDSMNSGEAQLISLVKTDMRIASKTMKRMISSQTQGDGSGKTIVGLQALLPSTGVGSNTLFNIAEANAPFWKNYFLTTAGSFATNGWHGSSDDKPTRGYLTCSDSGAEAPDYIFSDRTVFEYAIRAEGLRVRVTKDGDFGRIGMGALSGEAGKGLPFYDATWIWDNEVPAGYAYFVHSEDFALVEDPNFNFRWIPVNLGLQFLLSGMVLTYRVQSKVDRRNRNGVQTGWTA